jgi:hypothetical protein
MGDETGRTERLTATDEPDAERTDEALQAADTPPDVPPRVTQPEPEPETAAAVEDGRDIGEADPTNAVDPDFTTPVDREKVAKRDLSGTGGEIASA